MDAVVLFRPMGETELALIRDSGWRVFPPQLLSGRTVKRQDNCESDQIGWQRNRFQLAGLFASDCSGMPEVHCLGNFCGFADGAFLLTACRATAKEIAIRMHAVRA
jgi:hypothetical protein